MLAIREATGQAPRVSFFIIADIPPPTCAFDPLQTLVECVRADEQVPVLRRAAAMGAYWLSGLREPAPRLPVRAHRKPNRPEAQHHHRPSGGFWNEAFDL